jgi:Leucine-rich repeat (LRR) protein
MELTEVPLELFRMKMKTLRLFNNKICSLPSEIAHLAVAKLEQLDVRLSKRFYHYLTRNHIFQVSYNQLTSLPRELGLLTNLKTLDVR